MTFLDRRLPLGMLAAALAAGAAALVVALWPEAPPESDPETRLALGQRLYAQHCASCHGADLEGEPKWRRRGPDGLLPAPPHDETGHTWHHPDQQLFAITKFGTAALVGRNYRSNMMSFGDVLDDSEIRAVLDYIKSTWPEHIRRRQAEITARATQGG